MNYNKQFKRPRGPRYGGGMWRGGSGGRGGGMGNNGFGWGMQMQSQDVMGWLEQQHPFVIKQVYLQSKWLLQQHGINPEGQSDETANPGDLYDEEAIKRTESKIEIEGSSGSESQSPNSGKVPKHPGFGYHKQQMQWTPGGWVVKDNSHKVTSMMKPLPEPDIIPMQSSTYPEANADREKKKMLQNNANMLQYELNKILRKFKISNFNADDLTPYPEDQQQRLKTAVNCVNNAEKTLNEFKAFLRDEKYKDWNEEQKRIQEESIKSMIGEMPTGIPHKRKREEDPPQSQSTEQSSGAQLSEKAPIQFKQGANL